MACSLPNKHLKTFKYKYFILFCFSYPKYLAPEVLLLGYDPSKSWFDKSTVCDETLTLYSSKPKSDIWSLGMILLEMGNPISTIEQNFKYGFYKCFVNKYN